MSILLEAEGVVNGPRQDAYGDPVKTCGRIGAAWGALLGIEALSASTVANMMVVLKAVREESGPRSVRDNYVDMAGYAEIGARGAEIEAIRAEVARDMDLAGDLPPAPSGAFARAMEEELRGAAEDEAPRSFWPESVVAASFVQPPPLPDNVVALPVKEWRDDARTCGCPRPGAVPCRTPMSCLSRAENAFTDGEGDGA